MNYRVQLSSTPCQFGGKRYWFICPLVTEGKPCHRRVGVLYLAGKYMGCRDCYGLAYRSQQESSKYRAIGKFLSFSNEIDEKEKELRTRYWKGKPTKRYDRLIRKMEAMNGIARTVIDDMDKRNSQPEKRSINRGKRV